MLCNSYTQVFLTYFVPTDNMKCFRFDGVVPPLERDIEIDIWEQYKILNKSMLDKISGQMNESKMTFGFISLLP